MKSQSQKTHARGDQSAFFLTRTELAAAIATASAILLVCLAWLGMRACWMKIPPENSKNALQPPTREQAEKIVLRGGETSGASRTPSGWAGRLAAGAADTADYLMRVFTSSFYLSGRPDDRTFLSDIGWVLSGDVPDADALDKAERKLAGTGSRLAYINDLVRQKGLTGGIRLPAEATRLRTFSLLDGLPPEGSEVTGVLPVRSEVRLTGDQALFKIFTDGRFRQSRPAGSESSAGAVVYETDWDTRDETPGHRQLSLLLLTNDGRGEWVDIHQYVLPQIISLSTGEVLACDQAAGTAWYRLPAESNRVSLLMIGSDVPLELLLLDERGRQLCLTTGVAGRPAALRADFTQGGVPETIYVKIRKTAGDNDAAPARYRLVPALAAARPRDDTQRLLAVLDIETGKLQIRDENGAVSWQPQAGFDLIDPDARLSFLRLVLPDGKDALLAPAFDPEILEYGLYVDAGASAARIGLTAMEGSFAQLAVKVRQTGNSQDTVRGQDPDQLLELMPSRNDLMIDVTGFDGRTRQYEVHILRPPDGEGYDRVLERFPFSYRSPLWLLHLLHPAWQFAPESDGILWQDFINAEDADGLSLANEDTSPAGWIEADSPVYDGSSWKAAVRPVIAYFADPRNFLDGINIFQFEQLTYLKDVQTKPGVEAIIKNSFMAPGNTKGIDYAGIIVEAGEKAGISPYFLASKIIQEMGRQGGSPLSDGSLEGYEGVYNFYNIGSSPDPGIPNGAQVNGALFAMFGRDPGAGEITEDEKAWLLPWTSPEKAIIGGAVWIAERYVRIGQDTLYLQKFDLVASDGLYLHQYATNIQMAWAEGRRSRSAYSELNLLEQPFVFKIPIFVGMPDMPTRLPEEIP